MTAADEPGVENPVTTRLTITYLKDFRGEDPIVVEDPMHLNRPEAGVRGPSRTHAFEARLVLRSDQNDPRAQNHTDAEVLLGKLNAQLDDLQVAPYEFALPSWVGSGAILGVEGGMEKVDERLEAVYAAGVPLAGVWIQDWSGLVTTSFAKRVIWDWALDESYYAHFRRWSKKWLARNVRVLTYVNPYLSASYSTSSEVEKNLTSAEKISAGATMFREAKSKGYLVALQHAPSSRRRRAAADESSEIQTPAIIRPNKNSVENYNTGASTSTSTSSDEQTLLKTAVASTTATSAAITYVKPEVILPSATDDFQFGLLDLRREEVRSWFADVLLCNVMMTRIVPHSPCYDEMETDPDPLVWGWMADFGEYLPTFYDADYDSHNDTVNVTTFSFAVAEHHRYSEHWAEVNRLALARYGEARKVLEERVKAFGSGVAGAGGTQGAVRDGEQVGVAATDEKSVTSTRAAPAVSTALRAASFADRSDEGQYIFPFFRSAALYSSRILDSHWLGDQMVTFDACDGLQSAAIGALMAGFSGLRNLHSDLGGYTMMDAQRFPPRKGKEDHGDQAPHALVGKELLIRWLEYSAFSESAFRSHPGTKPNTSAQVYDEDILPYFKKFADVFQRGREYRELVMSAGRGIYLGSNPDAGSVPSVLPLMRHGALADPGSGDVWWTKLEEPAAQSRRSGGDQDEGTKARCPWKHDDCTSQKGSLVGEQQFFVGPDMLVSPVFRERQDSKKVYLPDLGAGGRRGARTRWRQLFTGVEFVGGGFVTVQAPLGQPPVFLRTDGEFFGVLEKAYGNLTAVDDENVFYA
eukprot:g2087.t1